MTLDKAEMLDRIGRSFIRIECHHRHGRMTKPWKIASYGNLDGAGWTEVVASSKQRKIEQKRKRAEVDELPPLTDDAPVSERIDRMVPAGDRPLHYTRLEDGQPRRGAVVEALETPQPTLLERIMQGLPPEKEPERWVTHDLTCPRCRKLGRRPAAYSRREEDLFQIFDELVALDPPVTTVTPEFLHKYENMRRKRDTPGR